MLTLSNGQQVDEATQSGNTQPDPGVAGLTSVIKGLEGGDYNNRSGDGGSSAGAFQWNNDNKPLAHGELPSHWKNAAAQYLKDPNAPMTPDNQNYVAYQQIKAYKDQGRTPMEIDALWNGAHKDATTGLYTHNSNARAQAFLKASNTSGTDATPPDTTNPTDTTTTPPTDNKPGFFQSLVQGASYPELMTTGTASRFLGSVISGGARAIGQNDFADKLDTSIQNANQNGIDYGYFGKVKPGGSKFDITKLNDPQHGILALGDAASGGVGTGLNLSGGEGMLNSLSSALGGGFMAKTAVQQALHDASGLSLKDFSVLDPEAQYNTVLQGLKNASEYNQSVIQQVLPTLKSAADEFKGLAPSIASKVVSTAGRGLLGAVKNLSLPYIGYQVGKLGVSSDVKKLVK